MLRVCAGAYTCVPPIVFNSFLVLVIAKSFTKQCHIIVRIGQGVCAGRVERDGVGKIQVCYNRKQNLEPLLHFCCNFFH